MILIVSSYVQQFADFENKYSCASNLYDKQIFLMYNIQKQEMIL